MGFSILTCAILTLHQPGGGAARPAGADDSRRAAAPTSCRSSAASADRSRCSPTTTGCARSRCSGPRLARLCPRRRGVAYVFTALFGISIMLIANRAFFTAGVAITDAQAVPKMAEMLGDDARPVRRYAYSVGFWAAVFASLLGVWQSVPVPVRRLLRHRPKACRPPRARRSEGDVHAVPARR